MPKAYIVQKDDPSGASGSNVKTPTVMRPLPTDVKPQREEEMSPRTCTDFTTFLSEHHSKVDGTTHLDKTHLSVIHQSISPSAWILIHPYLIILRGLGWTGIAVYALLLACMDSFPFIWNPCTSLLHPPPSLSPSATGR